MLIWAFALKKNYLNTMGNLPLDASELPEKSNDKTQS